MLLLTIFFGFFGLKPDWVCWLLIRCLKPTVKDNVVSIFFYLQRILLLAFFLLVKDNNIYKFNIIADLSFAVPFKGRTGGISIRVRALALDSVGFGLKPDWGFVGFLSVR